MTTSISGTSGITFPDSTVQPSAANPQGTAKAWVNFDGTTTATIRKSFNVSSVSRTATGAYTINFSVAMTDANYSFVFGGRRSNSANYASVTMATGTTPTPSSIQIKSLGADNTTATDYDYLCVSFFD